LNLMLLTFDLAKQTLLATGVLPYFAINGLQRSQYLDLRMQLCFPPFSKKKCTRLGAFLKLQCW